ncbi:hypothetical protein ACFPM0_25405 [Pseudonocardia sulfidoxydans]|uniref:hypothetical protein n=1 Tax=Pseudonocardia sulfidoxydans TaxID=54011 RepID=UPI000CD107B2
MSTSLPADHDPATPIRSSASRRTRRRARSRSRAATPPPTANDAPMVPPRASDDWQARWEADGGRVL